ncbi:MAG: glycosyltransferase family 2 protein [Candidatus Binatia bacterium]|nr:glycosyltransferase family 2 protein [Candidatus Binatia bacterium]
MTKARQGSPRISVVVPVYNEEGNAGPLVREIDTIVRELGEEYEILFVNDGSSDGTLGELIAALKDVARLRILDLDGNFGEAAALTAGFQAARGSVIVTLDGDGQNDPADIPLLWRVFRQGFAAVSGWRQKREEGFWLRVLPSRVANWMIARVTRVPLHDNGCGLKIYRAEVAKRVQLPRGFNRFLPAILGVGADEVTEVPVRDRRRQHGASHYGFNRTLIVLRDLLAMPFLLSKPTWFEPVWFTLALVAIVGTLALALQQKWLPALVTTTFALLSYAVAWNLRRFNRAQRYGVFRVRREFSRLGEGSLFCGQRQCAGER